eukprot:5485657-Prorocentrum_lima.AAC.1
MQIYRGKKNFKVVKVEWISPVLAVYFRPVNKDDFKFKEGQYLYLACPFINPAEWHPFTISSAADDLRIGDLISVATGEPVVEVPRPANVPKTSKWQKYCPISKVPQRFGVGNSRKQCPSHTTPHRTIARCLREICSTSTKS